MEWIDKNRRPSPFIALRSARAERPPPTPISTNVDPPSARLFRAACFRSRVLTPMLGRSPATHIWDGGSTETKSSLHMLNYRTNWEGILNAGFPRTEVTH